MEYGAFEALTSKADRPVKHLHHDRDEWFYVLEGEYEMHVEMKSFALGRAIRYWCHGKFRMCHRADAV
jgi:mannose-6-phosphate isomerase-like protein (cupin superfamily)